MKAIFAVSALAAAISAQAIAADTEATTTLTGSLATTMTYDLDGSAHGGTNAPALSSSLAVTNGPFSGTLTLTDKTVGVSKVMVTDGNITFGQLASIAGSHRVVGSLDKSTSELVKAGVAGIQWKNADLGLTVQLDGFKGSAGSIKGDCANDFAEGSELDALEFADATASLFGSAVSMQTYCTGNSIAVSDAITVVSYDSTAETYVLDIGGTEVTVKGDAKLSTLDAALYDQIVIDGQDFIDTFADYTVDNGGANDVLTLDEDGDGIVDADSWNDPTGSALALSVAFEQDFEVAKINASFQYKMSGSVDGSDATVIGDTTFEDLGLASPADEDDAETDFTDETDVTDQDFNYAWGTLGTTGVAASTSYLAGVGVTAPIGEIATAKVAYETNGEDGYYAAGVDAMLMGATLGATYTQITGVDAATIELMAGYAIEDLGSVSVKHVMNPVGGADVEVQADQTQTMIDASASVAGATLTVGYHMNPYLDSDYQNDTALISLGASYPVAGVALGASYMMHEDTSKMGFTASTALESGIGLSAAYTSGELTGDAAAVNTVALGASYKF
jgi:hypothetical protein